MEAIENYGQLHKAEENIKSFQTQVPPNSARSCLILHKFVHFATFYTHSPFGWFKKIFETSFSKTFSPSEFVGFNFFE